MKKISIYVLILVAMVGFLGFSTNAQAAPGACRWHIGSHTTTEGELDTSNPPLTKTQCEFNTSQGAFWDPNATPPASSLVGWCWKNGTKSSISNAECNSIGGTWQGQGEPEPAPPNGPTPPPNCIAPAVRRNNSCVCVTPNTVQNGKCTAPVDPNYYLLAPLPCKEGMPGCEFKDNQWQLTSFDPTNHAGENSKFGVYLNIIIIIFIGSSGVLAVVVIVVGGIEYMTSELPGNKESGKQRVRGAVFGIVLACGCWVILYQINPDILRTDFRSLTTQTVEADLGGEGTTPLTAATTNQLQNASISCPKSGGVSAIPQIAQSYIGHSAYSQQKRNTTSGGIAYVDCSSFATQVYVCAGLPNPGDTSVGIFSSGSAVVTSVSDDGTMVNGVPLKIGDLIGWKPGDDKHGNGHVMIYIGGGKMIDAQGGSGVGIRSVSQYKTRIKFRKP